MNNEELEFVLVGGEGQFVEFKESLDTKSLSKELVAFANSQGGRILLGINDQGIIKGVTITNKLKSEIQDLARGCDPQIRITTEELGKVLAITVYEGDDKPYSCSQGFYIRTGPNSQKLSRDEIIDFSIGEGKIRFDEQINSDFKFPEDFDNEKFEHFIKISGITKNLSTEEMLINLKTAKIVNDELRLNNAGVLFFAKTPGKFFINSKVVCVNYQTNEKVKIIDKKVLDNGIITNLEEAIDYVTKHINVEYEINGLKRKEIPQYPPAAYRESIVNSVMHRNYYQKSGNVMIEVFRNKLWVWNPGGLVKWLNPKNLGKYSMPRNSIIAELLSKTGYAEKVGSGINRIKNAMKESGLKEPAFEYDSYFLVVLNDKTSNTPEKDTEKDTEKLLSEQEKKILYEIRKSPKITSEKLAEVLDINVRNTKKKLSQLKNRNLLGRVGPAKGGYWKIINDSNKGDNDE